MNQETIENFIKNLGKQDFDGVASLLLKRVFDFVAIDVDGKGDGGSDYRIFDDSGGNRTISIQKTVQDSRWQEKAIEDATKSKKELDAKRIIFLTSRSHESASLRNLENQIMSTIGISATCMGATEIAGLLIDYKLLGEFAKVIGLSTIVVGQQRPDLREIMLHSYFALSNDRYELRESMYDRTIQAVLHFSESPMPRFDLEKKTVELLGCQEIRRAQVSGRIDSLLSRGHLVKTEKGIELTSSISESFNVADGIYLNELGQLAGAQVDLLHSYGGDWDQNKSEQASVLLAQMFVQKQIDSAKHISLEFTKTGFSQPLCEPEQTLRRLIYESGVHDATKINEVLYNMVDLARDKPLIKKITRSVIYATLENADPEKASLILGVTRWNDVRVLLDASVAIPYICSSLFAPTKGRFSRGSNECIYLLKYLSANLTIPYMYLNECASHLIRALDYCDNLKEFEDSFVYSQNCFVAHYYQLKMLNERVPGTLKEFIKIISPAAISPVIEDKKKIGIVMTELQPLLAEYGVNHENMPSKDMPLRYSKEVQEEYLWALDNLKRKKTQNLIDHDVQVLSYLRKCHSEENARMLCLTWDAVMISVGRKIENCGWIISPQEASDILQPKIKLSQGSLTSLAHIVARTMERPLELGAIIMDRIIKLGKEKLPDWEFRKRAKQFRDQMIARIDTSSPQYLDIFDQETDAFLKKEGVIISDSNSSETVYEEV